MKKNKWIILVMVLIFISTGSFFEQKGRIKGKVKDTNDNPIHGAKVKPEPQEENLPAVAEVETDEDGDYVTEELINALYLLNVTKDGYLQKQKDVVLNFSLFSNGDGFNCSNNVDVDVTLESIAEQEQEAEQDPNLVHYWNFNENTGSVLYDTIGGMNGTITGATWTTGKSGYALDFDPGANTPTRYVDFGTKDLSSLSNATIELWFTINEAEPECYNWLFTYYLSNSKYLRVPTFQAKTA